jgi:nucleoid-associated protein YgaU
VVDANRLGPHAGSSDARPTPVVAGTTLAEAWVPVPVPVNTRDVRRRDLLGGLSHEYYGAAA